MDKIGQDVIGKQANLTSFVSVFPFSRKPKLTEDERKALNDYIWNKYYEKIKKIWGLRDPVKHDKSSVFWFEGGVTLWVDIEPDRIEIRAVKDTKHMDPVTGRPAGEYRRSSKTINTQELSPETLDSKFNSTIGWIQREMDVVKARREREEATKKTMQELFSKYLNIKEIAQRKASGNIGDNTIEIEESEIGKKYWLRIKTKALSPEEINRILEIFSLIG